MSTFNSNRKQMPLFQSRETDEWETPNKLFRILDDEFDFTLDPCASRSNAKCNKFYTIDENGLNKSWGGERVFCNPPYSQIDTWVKKCYGERNSAAVIVLLTFSKTDTKTFHAFIYNIAELRFIKGRIKFRSKEKKIGHNAPFPSMLCIYRPNHKGDEERYF